MNRIAKSILGATLALVTASVAPARPPVAAATLPVTIRWQTKQPDNVSIVGEGGTERMAYDAANKSYSGTLLLSTELRTQRTILVEYDGQSYPLILNVRPAMAPITFTVARDTVPSCANPYVERVRQIADNMDDAMRRMLTAAHMLRILPDNNCTASRLPNAVRAQLERNANLARYSGGLFAINPAAREAYLKLAPAGSPAGRRAVALANAYDADARSAFAGRLYTDMKLAARNGDPATALALGDHITAAIDSDPAVAGAFADQGVTVARIERDTAFFQSMAGAPQ